MLFRSMLLSLRARLDAIVRPTSPFAVATDLPRLRVHWVEPQIVVQVAFMEWTPYGKLRHPRLVGIRNDSGMLHHEFSNFSIQRSEGTNSRDGLDGVSGGCDFMCRSRHESLSVAKSQSMALRRCVSMPRDTRTIVHMCRSCLHMRLDSSIQTDY